jgi:hypothetical protein
MGILSRLSSPNLDAAYWGLKLIAWLHATLRAVAVIPWNPKRQKNRFIFTMVTQKERSFDTALVIQQEVYSRKERLPETVALVS